LGGAGEYRVIRNKSKINKGYCYTRFLVTLISMMPVSHTGERVSYKQSDVLVTLASG
jgi:uncharacterized protein Veg